jgi:hypothetical protein
MYTVTWLGSLAARAPIIIRLRTLIFYRSLFHISNTIVLVMEAMDLQTTSHRPKAKCHLLDLPPELRLTIYDHLFGETQPQVCISGKRAFVWRGTGPEKINILATSHQINKEAQPILYRNAQLRVFVGSTFERLKSHKSSTSGKWMRWGSPRNERCRFLQKAGKMEMIIYLSGSFDNRTPNLTEFIHCIGRINKLRHLKISFECRKSFFSSHFQLSGIMKELKTLQVEGDVEMGKDAPWPSVGRMNSVVVEQYEALREYLKA